MNKIKLQRGDTLLVNGQAVGVCVYHRANHMTIESLSGFVLDKILPEVSGWTPPIVESKPAADREVREQEPIDADLTDADQTKIDDRLTRSPR